MSSQEIIDQIQRLYVEHIQIILGAPLKPTHGSNLLEYLNVSAISEKQPSATNVHRC